MTKPRRRVTPKQDVKPENPLDAESIESVDSVHVAAAKTQRSRGKGKRPIVPWPKFKTKEQTEFYEAMATEALRALSELTVSIDQTPTADPLAGIKASALAMGVTPAKAAWGRLIDTITLVIGGNVPIAPATLIRKAAMESLMLLVISRDG